MSRSYKKTYGWTDQQTCKHSTWYKRQANRRVRRAKAVGDGGGYKKLYCSWIICDFRLPFFSERDLNRWGEARASFHEVKPYKYMRK